MIFSALVMLCDVNDICDEYLEPRVLASGTGHLTFFKESVLITLTASVIEVSRSGLQLELDEAIEPGSKIELGLSRLIPQGEVEHCRMNKSGRHRLGILTHKVFDAAEFRHI